jgi:NitT/TauT family transport system substrate-binding protein
MIPAIHSKAVRFVIVGWLLAALLAACAPAATPTQTPTKAVEPTPTAMLAETKAPQASGEMTKLKVVSQPFITFVPYYIALKEGYFAEQGLEVELVNFNQTQQVLPALSSGQVDVSSGLVSAAMFNAIARGGEFKITSDKGYIDPQSACPSYVIIAHSGLVSEIKAPADLKGRAVDVVPATFLEWYLVKVLGKANLTVKDVKTSDLPATAELEAFANKSIDVTVTSEPWVTRLGKAGHQVILDTTEKIVPGAHGAVQLYGPPCLARIGKWATASWSRI